MSSRREKQATKKIAQERVEILLTLADGIYSEDPELAQRYGDLARKIVMKARIRMPEKWRIRFCRKCKKFLYPGITTHVRIKSGASSRVVYYCDICNVGKKSKQFSKSS
ncbi:MAG: ribonuclease P [Candidatus Heimdallarchaeota archaeon]|nr:ribonuclease P [Candidatus Heimdallarchaeota archaeon]MCK5183331.1 ribonuclease P [Candidatus Heimdallarchaeota archaeon]